MIDHFVVSESCKHIHQSLPFPSTWEFEQLVIDIKKYANKVPREKAYIFWKLLSGN